MEALLTWKYFLINESDFDQIKAQADELDTLRNRELSPEEEETKENLISQIDETASKIAKDVYEYKDQGESKDGTIMEELVYRMDEAPELRKYTDPDEFYFHFLVYITPEGLQKQYDTILRIFEVTADHDLLKEEFLGKWVYLERAREIFKELRKIYSEAHGANCGVVKIDRVQWVEEEEDETEAELEEVESDVVDA